MAPPAQPSAVLLPFEAILQTSPPDAPAAPPGAGSWHVLATYGQASAPRSQGFAEAATLSVAHDFPHAGPLGWSVEATPLFAVRETRVDLPSRPRETVFAFAAQAFLVLDVFPRSPVGVRLEAGAGPFWALSPVPAEGSRFNFYDVLGGRVRVRLDRGAGLAFGLRRTHVSNLGTSGPDNPGLSFYAGVLAFEWGR